MNRKYRPNPSRTVMIYGGFKNRMAELVLAKATSLMNQSDEPITLCVKSDGGSVTSLKLIETLWASKEATGRPQHEFR